MVIDPSVASRFIQEYKRFLLSIYRPEEPDGERLRTPDKLHAARERFIANRSLLDEYLRQREDGTDPIDREILNAIRTIEYGRWVYVRDLKKYSVFLKADGTAGYGVLGLMDQIGVIMGGPGAVVETGIFAYDEQYVCDGLAAKLAELGPNMRKAQNEAYQELRKAGKFLVNPLAPPHMRVPATKQNAPAGQKGRRGSGRSADEMKQARIKDVAELLDAFSQTHLTPEISGYVRTLWEQIGRKRKYAITGGKKEVWAAAVVYAIARLNFLFDSKNPNHLTADKICDFFGVKKTTVAARAADIEKACKLRIGQEGLCSPAFAEAFTFVKLPNGMVIPKSMARDAGLI